MYIHGIATCTRILLSFAVWNGTDFSRNLDSGSLHVPMLTVRLGKENCSQTRLSDMHMYHIKQTYSYNMLCTQNSTRRHKVVMDIYLTNWQRQFGPKWTQSTSVTVQFKIYLCKFRPICFCGNLVFNVLAGRYLSSIILHSCHGGGDLHFHKNKYIIITQHLFTSHEMQVWGWMQPQVFITQGGKNDVKWSKLIADKSSSFYK